MTLYLRLSGVSVTSALAIGGFPGISVPARYDSKRVPIGICSGRLKGSKPKLIEIVYGFEQKTVVSQWPRLSLDEVITTTNMTFFKGQHP